MRSAAALDSLCALSPPPSRGTNNNNLQVPPSLSLGATAGNNISQQQHSSPSEEEDRAKSATESNTAINSGSSSRRSSTGSGAASSSLPLDIFDSLSDIDTIASAPSTPLSVSATAARRRSSIISTQSIVDTSSAAMSTTMPIITTTDKENSVNSAGSMGIGIGIKHSGGKVAETLNATKACSSCHENLPKSSYSNAQWKKGKASNRRCADCIASGGNSKNTAVKNSSSSSSNSSAADESGGLAERTIVVKTKNTKKTDNDDATLNLNAEKKSISNKMDVERLTAALSFEPSSDKSAKEGDANDAEDGVAQGDDDGEEEVEDSINDTSTLTIEKPTPTKTIPSTHVGIVGSFEYSKNEAAADNSSDEALIAAITTFTSPAPASATNGASGLTVDTTGSTTSPTSRSAFGTPSPTASTSTSTNNDDAALSSVYSFSLYEAEVSLEHIQSSLQDDPEEILTVAGDALNLPCFKDEVIADMQGIGTTCSEATPTNGTTSTAIDGSPIRLNGIDTKHLSHLYSQLQMAATQSELALDQPNAALSRVVAALSDRSSMCWSYAVELGMIISDAYWCLGRADVAEQVKELLAQFVADEAEAAITTSPATTARSHAEELIADLTGIVAAAKSSDDQDGAPTEKVCTPRNVHKNDGKENEEEKNEKKRVTFNSTDDIRPESPVERELGELHGRQIVSSILKNDGYPEALDEDEDGVEDLSFIQALDNVNSTKTGGGTRRPDILQHVYNSYRSAYGTAKTIPIAGFFLELAENVTSTGIKIGTLGNLSLRDVDEKIVGPHIVKGVDDMVVNPIVETVGGVVDCAMHVGGEIAKPVVGTVGAVMSAVPLLGNNKEGEKEE
mmetsp:Transcript_8375/g.18854  ORF Transcript_8375/g.18854 Transcript_8375/m.18854 type:complete len:849 (-) Transcript_8375:188-2734(-)